MLAIVYVLRSGEVTFITAPYRRRVVWVSLREGRRGILRCSGRVRRRGSVGVQAAGGCGGCAAGKAWKCERKTEAVVDVDCENIPPPNHVLEKRGIKNEFLNLKEFFY